MAFPPPVFHSFDSRSRAARSTAGDIATILSSSVEKKGNALLLLSGGTTPAELYRELGSRHIPWEKVFVLPTDARWLSQDDDGSNDGMIRRTLLHGPAAAANFLPLYGGERTAQDALSRLHATISALPTPDVSLLGLGEDGHVASLFPSSGNFMQAMTAEGGEFVVPIIAPNAAVTPERLTLSLPFLLTALDTFIFFHGTVKLSVYEKALESGAVEDLPFRAVVQQDKSPVSVYWAE